MIYYPEEDLYYGIRFNSETFISAFETRRFAELYFSRLLKLKPAKAAGGKVVATTFNDICLVVKNAHGIAVINDTDDIRKYYIG